MTHGAKLGGHAEKHAMERAGVDPAEVEDVIMGCAHPEGATGHNIARQIAIRAGGRVTPAGVTLNRYAPSGLQSIAIAAQRVMVDKVPVAVAGGVEWISCVQNEMNKHMAHDEWLERHKPAVYMPMLQTAEVVASRYDISRERQDEFGGQSQQRAAAARSAGRFDPEIFPLTGRMQKAAKETGKSWVEEVTAKHDEGIRPDTTFEGVSKIKPAIEGRSEEH